MSDANQATADPDRPSISPGLFGAGIGFLLVAIGASFVLVLKHWTGLSVPGCGEVSGCDAAADSIWGAIRLGGFEWPTSHLGLAYFTGLFIAWIMSLRAVSPNLCWLVRFGAAGSLFLFGVMLVGGYFCPYCALAHMGNIGFLIVIELARRPGVLRPMPLRGFAGGLMAATLIVGTVEFLLRGSINQREEEQFARSQEQLAQRSQNQGDDPPISGGGFTGRYRLGPEEAPIRMVVFVDYQCEDCAGIENDIMAVLHERDDMSLSVKHFPFCSDCNRYTPSNKHPNACWAARAAETAGILGGNDAFWNLHEWMFKLEQPGTFNVSTLRDWVLRNEIDYEQWSEVMQGEETLARVRSDIEEAVVIGISQTPMIFINGVELKGWRVQNGIRRAVEGLAATNPPALSAAHDSPPNAIESSVAAWRTRPAVIVPPDAHDYAMGTPGAPLQVVVWGDLQEPFTRRADGLIRAFMEGRSDVEYRFRHYPINQACNPDAAITKHPLACLAHQAAEAAGQLGGAEAYWTMHAWLFAHQADLTEEAALQAATAQGLDGDAFGARMQNAEVSQAIAADAAAASRLGLAAVPFIFINGKFIERWLYAREGLPEGNVTKESLTPILRAAAGEE